MGIIMWLLVGLAAGLIARALLPGRDAMGLGATLVLGLIGSLVGGFLASMIQGDLDIGPAGLIGSILGALIALMAWRAMGRRHQTTGRHTTI